jgi:hypothetical protein
MALSASRRALQLSELVRHIFHHFDSTRDGPSLLAAACVNTIWADIATDILWHHPPYKALSARKAASHARLKLYYAPKIRALTLGEHDSVALDKATSPLARMRLPRLRELTLDADAVLHDNANIASLRTLLLGPPRIERTPGSGSRNSGSCNSPATQLTRFHFRGSARRLMDVLNILRDACAPLRELALICGVRGSPVPEPMLFLGFLEACSPLPPPPSSSLASSSSFTSPPKSLEFRGSVASSVTVPALVHLAGRPGLESLALSRCVTKAELEEVLQAFPDAGSADRRRRNSVSGDRSDAPQLFASLQRLTIGTEAVAVPLLLPHLTRLRHLELHLHDESQPRLDIVIRSVAALGSTGTGGALAALSPPLRSLTLLVLARATIRADDWLALCSLTELRALVVA